VSATYIALLRGINVGGVRIPMAELRALGAGDLGWSGVESYIQSGNLIFEADGEPAALEDELERAVERRFGYAIPVLVRRAADWPAYVTSNPFPGESEREAKLVMLALSKRPPKPDAVQALTARAAGGERIASAGGALWIHFASGSARSKLTPSVLDRLAGSPVTTRNWRTVLKLEELARGRQEAR
jgi:uncharacterized protein (DUF1697 family)